MPKALELQGRRHHGPCSKTHHPGAGQHQPGVCGSIHSRSIMIQISARRAEAAIHSGKEGGGVVEGVVAYQHHGNARKTCRGAKQRWTPGYHGCMGEVSCGTRVPSPGCFLVPFRGLRFPPWLLCSRILGPPLRLFAAPANLGILESPSLAVVAVGQPGRRRCLFLCHKRLRPYQSPVTGRQVKTEKKRGPSCTREGETAYLRTWSRSRCLPRHQTWLRHRAQNASEGMCSGSQCQASSVQGRTALSTLQPKLDGARRQPAKPSAQTCGTALRQVLQQAILARSCDFLSHATLAAAGRSFR